MTLYDYAQDVLNNVNAVWAGALVDLPALQYVAEGPTSSVSADCTQIVVSVDLLTRGTPGEPRGDYVPVPLEWSATLTISIWRDCVATSETEAPPLAADHATAAQQILGDLDLLWRNVKALFDAAGCRHHGVVTAGLYEVAGALGGSYVQASVDLLTV